MNPPRICLALAVGLLASAAAGCSDDNRKPAAKETVTVTATPGTFRSDEPSEDPDPFSPNVGDRALKVGQTREGRAVATTLHEVKIPFPVSDYRVPAAGNIWVGLRVEQCPSRDATGQDYSTYEGDFSLVTPKGGEIPGGGSSWLDWPTPRFPTNVTLTPGRCVKGWMALEAPRGMRISSILWRPGGITTAEWLP